MTTRKHSVNLSIASPLEIEQTARRLTAVREDFLNKGSLTLWTPRPLILDSWQRCQSLHVNPSQRCAPLAIAREAQLTQLHDENALLLQAAQPVIKRLTHFLSDSGYVVVLSDAQGRLLTVLGDEVIRRRLARIDFIPGGDWSEAAAGTNAIGTALADGHIVQLMAAEHYCDGWQDLTCTASPIHHPLTNDIIGILDVTGNYRLIRPFLTSFLAAAALEIKQRLYTLLLPQYQSAWQGSYYNAVVNHAKAIRTIENNMSEISFPKPNKASILSKISSDQTPLSLSFEHQRRSDAEYLVTATGIISSSLDLNVTLEKVVEQTIHLLHAERAGIYLFAEQDEPITLNKVSTQLSPHLERPDVIAALLQDERMVSLIRERGEPVVIDDTLTSTLLPATFAEQTGIRSLMLLPLVTARGVSGFITVSSLTSHQWQVADIRLGLAFAAQSATAVENARLFDTLQQHNRHIEALNAIAQILSVLPDPGQHLDLVLQRITEIIHLDTGMILLFDHNQDKMLLAAHHMLSQDIPLDLEQYPLKTLYTLARRIIDGREPLMIYADNCSEPAMRNALFRVGFSSLIAVPLTTGNAILGVMLLGNRQLDSYIKNDLKLFSTVGQQLGLALKNAQLLRSASEMEALREADRVKSGFLAAVSHDLRSPLTAIRASVESLLDADGIQSILGQEQLLRNIAGQANRLGQLVDQLLDLSRIEAGVLALDCDWTELSVLIADAVAEFERLHSGTIIEQALAPDIPLHYIDPDRLLQVLWNLLENAYKYAPLEMPIQVEARLTPEQEVLISVADRGPGIPHSEQEKVFQRFYRLERDQRAHTKGSGLGLAICRGIVEAHGGRIWVEDKEGGSIFFIALPPPTANLMGLEASEEQELAV